MSKNLTPHIPGRVYDQFFTPLVGSEAAIQELQDGLTAAVRAHPVGDYYASDPYDRLKHSFSSAVQAAAHGTSTTADQLQHLVNNGMPGIGIAARSLQTVGDIYTAQAQVPQGADVVRASARTATKMVYGVAFSGKVVGGLNLEALAMGTNPRNPLTYPLSMLGLITMRIPPIVGISRRSFKVDTDAEGQISITQRYRRLSKANDGQCPATQSRVTSAGGDKRPELLSLLTVLEDVVVKEIYPYQFPVKDTPAGGE